MRASRGVVAVEERRQSRLGGLDRLAVCAQHLCECHSARSVGVDEPMLVVGVCDGLTRLCPKGLVDRGHQGTADAQIDEDGHRSDHAHHRRRECDGEPHPDWYRAHSAALNL